VHNRPRCLERKEGVRHLFSPAATLSLPSDLVEFTVETTARTKRYGRWKIVKSLGQGGQGHVFVVEDSAGTIKGSVV
jgi:hypothetical protein